MSAIAEIVVTLVLIVSVPGRPDVEASRPTASVDECLREARQIVDDVGSSMRLGGNVSVMCDVKYPTSRED